MTAEELREKLELIQKLKCETPTLEIKSAEKGCPKHLYDSLSSFSNQDDGGVIVFGVDEEHGFKEVGVYDPQDIQKKINEQCLQMEPVVRPLLTVAEKNGLFFVAAEIPGADITERPVFYQGRGRVKGSFVRVGDSDEPMTEYEVYSYEAYRKKYQDDIRVVERATFAALNQEAVTNYIGLLKTGKPKLAAIPDDEIYELMSIKRNDQITLSTVMNFSPYPQAYFPQLCIVATVVPGKEIGEIGEQGERFLDNQRIEGNIREMLDGAMQFVNRNMHTKTIIDSRTGKREDRTDYPVTALRETILNALVHRDYSIHTERMPIQITMYEDRIEIRNPGGLYGRIRIDQLGKVQPDTRNPIIATELEVLKVTENRYSGIPTIRKAMQEYGLPQPEFLEERGSFVVKLYKHGENIAAVQNENSKNNELIKFCEIPRTRAEICKFLGLSSVTYAIQTHVMPLVEQGILKMSIPDKPKSPKQMFYCE
ncbi:ATP-dependent DNA helicase RecG [[Clostridium] aminophilum]|uniref:ATP-dependent DNA helicase RecG n=1 Tax=[Clostridium] aminophilum TaxID=1526 RepID=A0A1I0C8T6_9FIRM|nr:ATP-binding protein [[Clostridium] aminophilum]SET15802.1 ATP-dependent DNA helicase RecG [[Clostridium] aminophilum]